MNYRYCKRCNKINSMGLGNYCTSCLDQLDEYVRQIKEYISENPGVTITMVKKALDIDEKDILYLIKEKRIELTSENLTGLSHCSCARCGKPTIGEKYCNECKNDMAVSMQNASVKIRQKMEKNIKNKGVTAALREYNK